MNLCSAPRSLAHHQLVETVADRDKRGGRNKLGDVDLSADAAILGQTYLRIRSSIIGAASISVSFAVRFVAALDVHKRVDRA